MSQSVAPVSISADPLKRRDPGGTVPVFQAFQPTKASSQVREIPPDSPKEDAPDETELMMRVRRGDVEAFGQIMGRFWEPTFLYARHLIGEEDRAYDIVQESFTRLWERRREWELSGSVGGWLLRAARNEVITEQRRLKVRLRWRTILMRTLRSNPRTPLQHAENEELSEAIQRAIQELPPRRREVFILFHLQHRSYREIGEIMEIRPQTIANHLQAATTNLRAALLPFVSTTNPSEPSTADLPGPG